VSYGLLSEKDLINHFVNARDVVVGSGGWSHLQTLALGVNQAILWEVNGEIPPSCTLAFD
jgi:hypothetical protein